MKEQSKMQYREPTKLWNMSYILILLINTFIHSATQMVTPMMSKFALNIGVQLAFATTISGLMSVMALFFRPISGVCSDRLNRKVIIAVTNAGLAVCMALYSVTKNVTMLVIVRLLHGVFFSFNGVALMAFISMYIPKERIGEGMGWMVISNTISQSLGPALGLALADKYGFNVSFLTAAVICVCGVGVIQLIPYQAPAKSAEKLRIRFDDLISLRLLPYAILLGMFSWGNGLDNAFVALIGDDRGIANVALYFTIYSIFLVAVKPTCGKLVDKVGLRLILYPAYFIMAGGALVLGHASALWMIILAGALKAFGNGAGQPGIQATCLKQAGPERAGVASSTSYIGMDIGNALAPIVGGGLASAFDYRAPYICYAAMLIFIACPMFFIKYRYDKKKYGIEA